MVVCNSFVAPIASHTRIVTETLSDTIRDYCDTGGLLLQAAIRIDTYDSQTTSPLGSVKNSYFKI